METFKFAPLSTSDENLDMTTTIPGLAADGLVDLATKPAFISQSDDKSVEAADDKSEQCLSYHSSN